MVDISKFLERAQDAFKKRNYDYAVQMYLEALQVDPANIDARMTLRMVLLKAHEDSAAIKPPSMKTMMLSRDPKVVLTESEKAVVKDPRSAKYNMRVADSLVQLGFHEAAGMVFQYVVDYCDKGKENLQAMKSGAKAFTDAQKVDLAQKLLSKARSLAPQDKEIADLARNSAAASTLSKISAAKDSRGMLKDAGEAAELELLNKKVMSTGELQRAMQIVNDKLQATPSDKQWVKKKAELFAKAKQYDNAYKWLMSRYEDLGKPSDVAEVAVKYKALDFDTKEKYCELKSAEEPLNAAEWKAKAEQVRVARRQFELKEFQRQVEEAPADLDKQYECGRAMFESGMFAQAVGPLQKAARSPKIGKKVGVLLGRCFAQMKRLDLAEKQLQNVRSVVSEAEEELFSEVRYWLADVYERQGMKDKAVGMFQELFMENATFRDVGTRLDRLQNRDSVA